MPLSRIPGVPSKRPFYFGALNGAQNVDNVAPDAGGCLLEVSANNGTGGALTVTVADGTGTLRKFTVPANGNWEWRPIDGATYYGQLTVTTSGALDVTVRTA